MRRLLFAPLALLVMALLVAAPLAAQPLASPPLSPLGPKHEMRAAWIATVINLDWPTTRSATASAVQQAQLVSMLDGLQASGVNAVFFQVRSEADAMYDSPYEPWSHWLTGAQGTPPSPFYDPLAFAVEEAHARGMELHAWLNPYRADRGSGYAQDPTHVTQANPEWMLEFGALKIFDPGLQASRDRVALISADIARRYDVDGIHFDDYFYPYPPNNITNEDQATFQADPRGFTSINDWRRDNVNLMVAQVQDSLQAIDPELAFGISPFGIWRNGVPSGITGLDAYNVIFADALAWMNAQTVDYLVPQTYWKITGPQDFERLSAWWGDQRNDRHVYAGHGLYRTDAATFSGALFAPTEIPRQVRLTRDDPDLQGGSFFRAKNLTVFRSQGFRDSLQTDLYRRAALTPTMDWKSLAAPAAASSLAPTWNGDDLTLAWDPSPAGGDAETQFYAVYRINAAQPGLPASLDDPENLVAVTGETTFTDRPFVSPDPYHYVVTAVSPNSVESGPTNVVTVDGRAVSSEPEAGPVAFALDAPRPNPSRGAVEMALRLATPGRVSVHVVDVLGRRVATLVDDAPLGVGAHDLRWDGRTHGAPAPAGTYLVVLDVDGRRATRALTIAR